MSKRKKVFIITIMILLLNSMIMGYIWFKTKNLIQSSYDNYGRLPADNHFLISERNYSKIARRIDLSNDSRLDHSTGQIVYGKEYTEHYKYRVTSEYGFLFFMIVNYRDDYLPQNKNGQYYPASYGDRPCSITWILTLKGWRVVDLSDTI